MNLEGKVERLFPVQSGTSARTGNQWTMMDFMVETMEQYPKKVVFTLSGEDRIKAANLKPGLIVNVHFDLDTRFYTGKDGVERYNLGARAYRVDIVGNVAEQQNSPQVNYDQVAQNFFDQQPVPQHTPMQQTIPQSQLGGNAGAYPGGDRTVPGYGQQMQGSQQGYQPQMNGHQYVPGCNVTGDLPI